MRGFLVKLGGFVLTVAAGYFALFLLVIALHVRAADKSCHLNENVSAVILGDSHMMWSINDAKIPNLRNIALNAEGYKYSYLKLRRVLEQQPQVKQVYLGAGFHNLSGYYDDYIFGGSFKFFAYRYLAVLSAEDYVELFTKDPLEFLRLTKHSIVEGFKPGLKGQCELYGTFPEEKQLQVYDPKSMEKRVQSQFFDGEQLLGTSKSNLHFLKKITDLCEERGVALTLLNTPLHADYTARVPEPFQELLLNSVTSHGVGYYDFSELKLPDAAFLPDGDHLNSLGAQLTSDQFRSYHLAHIKN